MAFCRHRLIERALEWCPGANQKCPSHPRMHLAPANQLWICWVWISIFSVVVSRSVSGLFDPSQHCSYSCRMSWWHNGRASDLPQKNYPPGPRQKSYSSLQAPVSQTKRLYFQWRLLAAKLLIGFQKIGEVLKLCTPSSITATTCIVGILLFMYGREMLMAMSLNHVNFLKIAGTGYAKVCRFSYACRIYLWWNYFFATRWHQYKM